MLRMREIGDEAADRSCPLLRNTNLLRSANKYGKNVKAIAVTGSINAITMGDVEDRKRRLISSTEWLPVCRPCHLISEQIFVLIFNLPSSPETTP